MRKVLILSTFWLLFFAAGFALIFLLLGGPMYRRLAKGLQAQGTVTDKRPDEHNLVYYRYFVGQREYSGHGLAGYGNASFEKLRIGDPVLIYYESDEPGSSCLGDAEREFRSRIGAASFLGFFLATGSLIGLGARGWLPR